MGMDVYGRNPADKDGEYFRANVWSWRPIHQLMIDLCSDLLTEEQLRSMSYNDGAGPKSAEVCKQIANRFDAWMEQHVEGTSIECTSMRVKQGTGEFADPTYQGPTESPYRASDEHLKVWVKFLRSCGGFKVC